MQLFDTHCHIQDTLLESAGGDSMHALWLRGDKADPDALIARAREAGVVGMICVGNTLENSRLAVEFVQTRPECWASVGVHPHEAEKSLPELMTLRELIEDGLSLTVAGSGAVGGPGARSFARTTGGQPERRGSRGRPVPKLIAIGECGLDYHYGNASKQAQEKLLRYQIELALEHDLPLIFHVRDAFDDFWPIFDDYKNIRGVLHSFTDVRANLDEALARGLYIGLNGIITFTKHQWQLEVAKAIPLERLLLETDAPFLTPNPLRVIINEPAYAGPPHQPTPPHSQESTTPTPINLAK